MNLETTSEAELVGLMADQVRHPDSARSAWEELYRRHVRYVFSVLARTYGTVLRDECLPDLVTDTFRRAYEWSGRQASPSAARERFRGETAEATRRRVLAWLGVIAERLLQDWLRQSNSEPAEFACDVDDRLEHRSPDEARPASPALHSLRAALSALSPDEAAALRVCLPWYDVETRSFALPRGEAARIADSLGVKPDTLRQRRYRALKRIAGSLSRSELSPGQGTGAES